MFKDLELQPIQEGVQKVITEGRLGRPAFFRCVAQTSTPCEELPSALKQVLAIAESWFGGMPQQLYTLGSESSGQLTVAAKWPGGQGALVSVVALSTGQDPKMDMVLLGGRGAVYFET